MERSFGFNPQGKIVIDDMGIQSSQVKIEVGTDFGWIDSKPGTFLRYFSVILVIP
jgi:hypothetical protein